jgi:hypothetical protein
MAEWQRYFGSPLLCRGEYEPTDFYLWRIALLARLWPEAVYPLYLPAWAAGTHIVQGAPLGLARALGAPAIWRVGSNARILTRGALQRSGPIQDGPAKSLMDSADAYAAAAFEQFAAGVAVNPAHDRLRDLELAVGEWTRRVAATELVVPRTVRAAELLRAFVGTCITPLGRRKADADAATMTGDAIVEEHVLRECTARLEWAATTCADYTRGQADVLLVVVMVAYTDALGRSRRELGDDVLSFLEVLRGHDDNRADRVALPMPVPTADSVFATFLSLAGRGTKSASLAGHTITAIERVMATIPHDVGGPPAVLPVSRLTPAQLARNSRLNYQKVCWPRAQRRPRLRS